MRNFTTSRTFAVGTDCTVQYIMAEVGTNQPWKHGRAGIATAPFKSTPKACWQAGLYLGNLDWLDLTEPAEPKSSQAANHISPTERLFYIRFGAEAAEETLEALTASTHHLRLCQ